MPKLKSHKSSLRRMKVTATGKVLVHPTGGRHLMSGKSSKKRRHIRRARLLKGTDRMHTMKALHRSQLLKKAHVPAPAPTSTPEGV